MWLAGLLEGEGSFIAAPPSEPNRPRISISMTDLDVIERVSHLFGVGYVGVRKYKNKRWKPSYAVIVRGRLAVDLMGRLRPHMGIRRQKQIDQALAGFTSRRPGDNNRKLSWPQVRLLRKRMEKESLLSLSKEFGVARRTLRRIREGEIWKEAA